MTRILMLVTNDVNPDPRVQREAEALVSEGYGVGIAGISSQSSTDYSVQHANGIHVLRLHLDHRLIERFKLGWVKAFFTVLLFSCGCLREAKSLLRGVSIIHAHDFDTLPIGFILSRMSNAKLIYDAHESYSEMFSQRVPKSIILLVNALERVLSRRANRIIASGYLLGKRMEALSGRQVDVIQNTVSEDFGRKFARKKLNDFEVGYVGGFLDDRNLYELVEAFKRFWESHQNSKLVLAGWGPLSDYLRKEASQCPSCFEFLGKVDYADVPIIISRLSVSIVFLSKQTKNNIYATPNKAFESISLGVPLLASDFGELKRIVAELNLGILVKSWDIDDIIRKLEYSYNNRDDLWKLGMRAREKFITDLSWEKIMLKLFRVYDSLRGA